MQIDRVVMSVNDDPAYYGVLPMTVATWRRWWPGVRITLGLVTAHPAPALAKALSLHGTIEVQEFAAVRGVHIVNQAKTLRHFIAAQCGRERVAVHDIDSVHLTGTFLASKLYGVPDDAFFALGSDVWGASTATRGKFRMSDTTATGALWAAVLEHPATWEQFVREQYDIRILDRKEAINQRPVRRIQWGFSDESWLRARLRMAHIQPHHVPFGRENFARILCDRHGVPQEEDVRAGRWIEAHHMIPWQRCRAAWTVIQRALGMEGLLHG